MTQVSTHTTDLDQAAQAQTLLSAPCVSLLSSLSILRVKGSNSGKLLHGQLTHNIETMQRGDLRQAAACSPKGRIYATGYVVHQGEAFDFIMPRSTLPTAQQTLSKFAPLYRCQLEDLQGQYGVVGYNRAEPLVGLPDSVQQVVLPDASRSLLLCPSELQADLLTHLAQQMAVVEESVWQLLNIRAVHFLVEQSHSDQFIPQMLNYQAVGAISFKKGCYTGQEIIARAQYRGGVKKRLQRLVLARVEPIAIGTSLYLADQEEPIGEVLLSACNEHGQQECLAIVKDSALDAELHLGTVTGERLQVLTLPYGLEKLDI